MRAKWAVNSQQLGPCVGFILNRSGQTAPRIDDPNCEPTGSCSLQEILIFRSGLRNPDQTFYGERLVKFFLVCLFDLALRLHWSIATSLIGNHLRNSWHYVTPHLGLLIPKAGARNSLGPVKKNLPRFDKDDRGGQSAFYFKRGPQIYVIVDCGIPVYPHHFGDAGNEENRSYGRVCDDIGQGINPVVTTPVGNGDCSVVTHDFDKSWCISAR